MKRVLVISGMLGAALLLASCGHSGNRVSDVPATPCISDARDRETEPTAGQQSGQTGPTVTGPQIDDPGITATPAVTEVPLPTATITPTPTVTPTPTATPTPAPTAVPLFISEVLPTNSKYDKHDGEFCDVIEIGNTSDEPVMLSGYYLSDSKKRLNEYPLPETEIPGGGYAVFYCVGTGADPARSELPFRLSYFGEKVYLADAESNIIDELEYPELPRDVSCGRVGEDVRIFDEPSPGEANEGGYERMATIPTVDLAPGFYEGAQEVSFSSTGVIRYTLDGSKPDASSKIWDGEPIRIVSTCALRAYAEEDGCLASFDASFNYFIDVPEYTLDVAYLSIKEADFKSMNRNASSDRKYAANLSLFSGGNPVFSENCAVTVAGSTSRKYDKKSYQVTFSTAYGPSKLRCRVFEDLEIEEFNSLVLRSGSQENQGSLMKDEYVSSLSVSGGVIDDVLVQAYRPVNLYVNGNYWGIYYIREHIDEHMVASHCGCEPEEVTVIKHMNSVKCGNDAKEWTDFWSYISSHKLTSDEAYAYVRSVVDVQSVADYYIIQLWSGNIDPDNVCVFKAGGLWRFALYDCDLTLCRAAAGTTANLLGTFNPGYYTFNALIYRLLENEEFRELFCARMSEIFSTVFADDNALAYLDALAGRIDRDMVYNCDRWHPVRDSSGEIHYHSYKTWQGCVNTLRRIVTGRTKKIAADFIEAKKISKELAGKYFPDLK